MYEYRGRIALVYDGDTLHLIVDLGFGISHGNERLPFRVRLVGPGGKGFDAPEMHAKDPADRARAVACRDRVRALLPVGAEAVFRTYKPDPSDKYGRWLASVVIAPGDDLATLLVAEGLGAWREF